MGDRSNTPDGAESGADDEVPPDDEDLDRLMAEADPDLATPGEKSATDDPVGVAKESDTEKVKQELDLSNPDSEKSLDQFERAEPFEGGEIDPDRDIRDPKIRQAVKQAKQKEKEQEEVEADSDTPVRVDNSSTDDSNMSDSDDDHEPVSNSEPETPNKMDDERYQSDNEPADPFEGDDEDVAEAMSEWDELTTAEDIDPETFNFEDQDFEQVTGLDEAVVEFKNIYVYLTKPEDDEAEALMARIQSVQDQGEMFDMVIEEVVEKPYMGDKIEEWGFWERAALAGRCMQFLGLDDMGEF